MKKQGKVIVWLTALLFVCFISPCAGAQSFLLSKVVDRKTPIPDGSGNFTLFLSGNPVISGNNIAFYSGGGGGQEGIYLYRGTTLSKVADRNTPIPGGSGNFTLFSSTNPVISGNNVAFEAGGASQQGFYIYNGTNLTKAVDLNTPIPGGSGNFTSFSNLAGQYISNNNLVFDGDGMGIYVIYLYNGTVLSKVADYNTPIPEGSGNFTSFSNYLWISGDNVVFVGGAIQYGIYLYKGMSLSKVADYNTPIPGGSGNFTALFNYAISGTNVVFLGYGTGGQDGLYFYNGTTLSKIVDPNTSIPGGSGSFNGFFNHAISGTNVVFLGSGVGGQNGIYLFNGTALSKVVDLNTPIPGGSGNFTGFFDNAISGTNVVFLGSGVGGQRGIYLFNGTTLSKVVDLNTPIPGGSGNFTGLSTAGVSDDNIAFVGSGVNQYGYYLASLQNPAVAVPTISEWGMIMFMLLAGLGTVYYLRRKQRA